MIQIDIEKDHEPYYQFAFTFCNNSRGWGEVSAIAIYSVEPDKLMILLNQLRKTNYLFGLEIAEIRLEDSDVLPYICVTIVPNYITHHNMDIYDADTYFFAFKVSFKNNCTFQLKNRIDYMIKTVSETNGHIINANFEDLCLIIAKQTRNELKQANEDETDINGVSWILGIWVEILANVKQISHRLGELFCKSFYIYFNVDIEL